MGASKQKATTSILEDGYKQGSWAIQLEVTRVPIMKVAVGAKLSPTSRKAVSQISLPSNAMRFPAVTFKHQGPHFSFISHAPPRKVSRNVLITVTCNVLDGWYTTCLTINM